MTKKIKLKISARLMNKRSRRANGNGAKHCRFCASAEQERTIDYKNTALLKSFFSERGKILPSRISGNCAKHQRHISGQIRKARTVALLPYTTQFGG